MPILQNAREVHLNRCEFRDIQGNYYDHRNAGRQQAIGPEYTRFGGQSIQTSQSMPGLPPPGADVWNRIAGMTDGGYPAASLDPVALNATLDALFSPPGANAAISQSPFNSQPPFNTQNYPFGSSPHGFTAGAVNGHPPALTQIPQGPPAGGRNTNPANVEVALPASPAPNRSVSPNLAGSAPSNSGLNGTLSNFSYIATSYHGAPRTTAFPTSPTSNGQDLQFPDNANATAQSVYIGNLSTPSSQSSNTTNLSTLPSQSPGNTDFSTQSFQFVAENMIGGATNGGTATVGSTPSERSPTHNGQTSPERGAAPSPANALANNEALANAPLERQTGFLGF